METKEKFVAVIDILGFSRLVEKVEAGQEQFERLLDLVAALGTAADGSKFGTRGPTTCPHSHYIEKNLDFVVTQISDCVIISAEVSPAGIVNLVNHCFGVALGLMHKGAQCRGMITRGRVYHTPGQVIGTAYQRAAEGEKTTRVLRAEEDEIGTPFIELNEQVVAYIRDETDECVQDMVGRVTTSDGEYTAIYPFKALINKPFVVLTPGVPFQAQEWLESVRRSLGYRKATLKTFQAALAETQDRRVRQKISHYLMGLEALIAALKLKEDRALQIVETGQIPWGTLL